MRRKNRSMRDRFSIRTLGMNEDLPADILGDGPSLLMSRNLGDAVIDMEPGGASAEATAADSAIDRWRDLSPRLHTAYITTYSQTVSVIAELRRRIDAYQSALVPIIELDPAAYLTWVTHAGMRSGPRRVQPRHMGVLVQWADGAPAVRVQRSMMRGKGEGCLTGRIPELAPFITTVQRKRRSDKAGSASDSSDYALDPLVRDRMRPISARSSE